MTRGGTVPDGAHEVRCPCCHRTERWGPGAERTVLAEGGVRRPIAPWHQAFDVVEAALSGEGPPVVGACPACGQPMVGFGPEPIPWTFALPSGAITVQLGPSARGPEGPIPFEAAAATIRQQPRGHSGEEPQGWPLFLVQVTLLLLMLTPLAVWVFSILYVSVFLSHIGEQL